MIQSLTLVALLGYNIYFADMHSHTAYSDGQGLPREAYTYARDTAQIDVLALTDHTSYLNSGTYAQEREVAAEFTEPGRFVALAGQEFGSLNQFGHFSVYDAESLRLGSSGDLTGFYQWIVGLREPVQFNHPRTGDFNNYLYDQSADAYATTFEVVNGSGLYTPGYEQLFNLALDNGWHCAPVANQDNHNRKWGNWYNDQRQIALTGIWADTLTRDAIMSSLLARRVYAMEVKPANDRIRLRQFVVTWPGDSVEMGSSGTIPEPSATFKVDVLADSDFRQLYIYRDGAKFDSASTASLDTNHVVWQREIPFTNSYYYIKGEQVDGDHFWSAPVWLSYRAPPKALEFWPNPLSAVTSIVLATDSFPVTGGELNIFDAAGNPVRHRSIPEQQAGYLRLTWDGKSDAGKVLPTGIYLVRVVLNYADRKTATVAQGKLAIER